MQRALKTDLNEVRTEAKTRPRAFSKVLGSPAVCGAVWSAVAIHSLAIRLSPLQNRTGTAEVQPAIDEKTTCVHRCVC